MDSLQAFTHDPTPGGDAEREHQLQLQEEFEFAPDCQLLTCGHGLVNRANQAGVTLLRCSKEFLVGKPLGLFVTEGHRPRFYESLSRLWQGSTADQFETRISRRGEEPRTVAVRVVAIGERGDSRYTFFLRWVLRDITDLRRVEAAHTDLLHRLMSAQEDERRRISRELHDSVGQLLTALTLAIKTTRDSAELAPQTEARLSEVQQVADELGRVTHDLAVRLRPTVLDDVGLSAALAQHVSDWSAHSGVEVDYEAAAVERERLPRPVETAVYRVVQEALTNVARHAAAVHVSVVVGRHANFATVAIEDDGCGFDPEEVAASGRLGLLGMRERVLLNGGTLDIESSPGQGTTVLARFPLQTGGG
jgi:signal transduction histidine kinase